MNDINATEADPNVTEPVKDTPPLDQQIGDAAEPGTASADNSSGDANSSSTSQTGNESTDAAMERMSKQLAGDPKQQTTTQQPDTVQPQLTLQQVQETLGLKSLDDLKRLQNQTSLYGRQANELGTLRKQLSEVSQQQQAERQRQEQEAARAALSPFHAKHPQFQMNTQRVTRAQGFLSAVQALPPEMQNDQNMVNRMAQQMGVNKDDISMAHQSREYREQQVAQIANDPEGFVEQRAERVVQQALAKFDEYLNNRMQAQSFVTQHQSLINDPVSQQIMAKALDPATSRSDLAIQLAQTIRERDELLSKAHRETAEVETLKAKEALSQPQTFTRRRASTSTTTQTDPWDSYKENTKDPKAAEALLERMLRGG